LILGKREEFVTKEIEFSEIQEGRERASSSVTGGRKIIRLIQKGGG